MPYKDPAAQREAQRVWYANRRAEFVAGQTCKCGSAESLELHHRDKDQKVSHRIWSWSRKRIVAEIAKCEWLCATCHDQFHAEERRAEAIARRPHGTRHRYELGCKCALCRRAKTLSNRIYRLRGRIAMAITKRETWVAVVQNGDDDHDQETELVTIEFVDAEPRTIETTDGRRITLLEPAAAA